MALCAETVDAMGGSCAESLDNQSRAVVINAHGSLGQLCWRGVFSSVDRSESSIRCLGGHARARMGIPRARGSLDQLCWRGAGPCLGGLLSGSRWSQTPQEGCRTGLLVLGSSLGGLLVPVGVGCWLGWPEASLRHARQLFRVRGHFFGPLTPPLRQILFLGQTAIFAEVLIIMELGTLTPPPPPLKVGDCSSIASCKSLAGISILSSAAHHSWRPLLEQDHCSIAAGL